MAQSEQHRSGLLLHVVDRVKGETAERTFQICLETARCFEDELDRTIQDRRGNRCRGFGREEQSESIAFVELLSHLGIVLLLNFSPPVPNVCLKRSSAKSSNIFSNTSSHLGIKCTLFRMSQWPSLFASSKSFSRP